MKKLKLILHIGAGKTGTTALQSFLKLNQLILQENGIHYLNSPLWGDNSHHLFGFGLWGKEHLDLPNIPDVNFNNLISKIKLEIEHLPESIHSIIISTELLFEIADTQKINPLLSFVNQNFSGITIIAYLRRQDEHIQSLYQHWIKTGHKKFRTKTITQFVDEFAGDDYYSKLNAWANHFGKQNMIVKLYEKSSFLNQNLFSDFLHCLNIEHSANFQNPPEKNTNLSINPEATEILRLCPDFDYNQLYEIWPDSTKTSLTGYTLLSADDKQKILEKFSASNQKVAREFLNREDGKLFLEPIFENTNQTQTNNEMPFEFMVPTLMSIFKNQHQKIKNLEDQISILIENQKANINRIINSIESGETYLDKNIIYLLNQKNFSAIKTSADITGYLWKNGELEIEASGADPNMLFSIDFKNGKNYLLKVIMHSSVKTTSQLFYTTESHQNFNEKNSFIIITNQGLNEHIFKLQNINLFNKLRFDPSNLPGKFIIKSFVILEF